MAIDKAVDSTQLDMGLTSVATAIRTKGGTSADLAFPSGFVSAVNAIPAGTPLPSLTDPAAASDILDGKEAIDGQGQILTGTLVPPTDTGANGLYKEILETNITEISDTGLTALRTCALELCTPLKKVSLPNLLTLGERAFSGCSNLTGIVDLGQAVIGRMCFSNACKNTTILKFKNNGSSNNSLSGIKASHLWLPTTDSIAWNFMLEDANNLITIQFDVASSIPLGYTGTKNNLRAVILRNPTGCALASFSRSIPNALFYVPKNILASFYSTATNWTSFYNDGKIIGIDQDTTATVGIPFTPTATATGIASWDQVDLQSYSVGTVNSTTGAITPTHDGRLLIRGLDGNGNILHVTYLQIGTGFDEEANLA